MASLLNVELGRLLVKISMQKNKMPENENNICCVIKCQELPILII